MPILYYNKGMEEHKADIDITRLLYLAVGLWLGYLFVLAIIDHAFYPRPVFPPPYYLINGLNVLVLWGLMLWSRERPSWTRVTVPLVIGIMSVVPLVTAYWVLHPMPVHPANDPEARLLRLMPLLLMALILTAWRYRLGHVIGYSLGVAGLSMSLQLLFHRPGNPVVSPPVTVLIIQTISFLIVGYFINALMNRLKQQRASLAEANAQLTHYASTLEHLTISRERNRMARELHDTLAHTLSGLSVQLEAVKAYWDVDPGTAQRLLGQSLDATRSGLQETRRALKSLRASPLDDLGLLLAIRQLAESAAARANLHLELRLPLALPTLSTPIEQCLYRVAQEAIANAVYHANAHTLTVQLSYDNPHITLTVHDDGLGFDPQQANQAGLGSVSGHYGLAGMRERAALVGGDLIIESQRGAGTEVRLSISIHPCRDIGL